MEHLLSILSGGLSGALLIWLAKGWLSERLKQSIQHEYSEKLESYKTELNTKIESMRHENQVTQLRTSLFFDHQRNAYVSIITRIAEINRKWVNGYDPDVGELFETVPYEEYSDLRKLLNEHQLFLDDECLMALELAMDIYSSSFPYDDGSGAPPHQGDSLPKVSFVDYLQPRIASIFKSKIGVESYNEHLKEVAILTAIKLVNKYSFREVGIPPEGNLSTKRIENAADMVAIGEKNSQELLSLLRGFNEYLSRDGGWFPEAQLKVKQCLRILEKIPSNQRQEA
jgi:hypothetical protein